MYLRRNLSPRVPQATDEAVVEALKQVAVHNGLECKISCANSKVGGERVSV